MEGHRRVAYSDDDGKTWSYPFDAPFLFGRPFTSGDDLYVIARDSEKMTLAIYQSKDEGETWDGPYELDTRTWLPRRLRRSTPTGMST